MDQKKYNKKKEKNDKKGLTAYRTSELIDGKHKYVHND